MSAIETKVIETKAIETKVNELLLEVLKKSIILQPEFTLTEDLQLDSLRIMELMSLIEDEYDVIIPVNKALSIKTVGELYYAVAHIDEYSA